MASPLVAAGGPSSTFTISCTYTITPTFSQTGTITVSPTVTATPTATTTNTPLPGSGQGSYTTNPSSVVATSGNSMSLDFIVGSTAFTTGLISFQFPAGFDPPTSSNFFLRGNQDADFAASYNYSGGTCTVQLSNVPSGTDLQFLYGYFFPNTFSVNSVSPTASFLVSCNPYSTDPSQLANLASQPNIVILQPTPTSTITQTFTISPTFSPTPTISPTCTITLTFTLTPIAALNPNGAFTYPNPFDLRAYNKVTFRFPPDTNVRIQVYNLAGEPVVTLDTSLIDMVDGWAIWNGQDDYGRFISGGLYFYRIQGDTNKWVGKFTVVH